MVMLGLDYGDRYCGVAITDPDAEFALRFKTIDGKKDDVVEEVVDMVEGESVKKIVVGLPKSLSGTDTEQTNKTKKFIDGLKEELGDEVEIEVTDETMSSKEARQRLLAEGEDMSEEHAEAARLILENYTKRIEA